MCATLVACDAPGDGRSAPLDGAGDSIAGDASAGDDDSGVCARWQADRSASREGTWSGSAARCEAGDYLEPGRSSALRLVNLYRSLAALPPVALADDKNREAQECALVMHANDTISHQIPDSWACWSERAESAALLCNVATTAAVASIDLYMTDQHVETLGHRRWILSNTLGPIGVGSTSGFSCLHVINGDGRAGARWTAWPPPGEVPLQALRPMSGLDADLAGWSIQSDFIDLRRGRVTVTRDGEPLEVEVWPLEAGYGSTFGLGIRPVGWRSAAGATYDVAIDGLVEPIAYRFTLLDCD